MKPVVVVGGGVAGLLAAILAGKKGHPVAVIEEEQECGGLLRSFTNRDGVVFDYGIHIPKQTGLAPLDHILFGDFDNDFATWQRIPYLKNGTFFKGTLYEKSPFINANHLPKELYEKGIAELIQCIPPDPKDCANCEEYIKSTFGPTFLEYLFRPAITKFSGVQLNELAPTAHDFFDLNRILAFTPELSRELKKSPSLDARIGYHFSDEGRSNLMNYYPTSGGIGQWVDYLVKKATNVGVQFHLGARVEKLNVEKQKVASVVLTSGQIIECEHLIWSVPPFPLVKAAGLTYESTKIKVRTSNLYYFVYDKPIETECMFFVCMDESYRTFRVSVYSNLRTRPRDKAIHAACIEVNDNELDIRPETVRAMGEELKHMKLVDRKAKVLYQEGRGAKLGFPVFTPQFIEQGRLLRDFLNSHLSNLILNGKGSGKTFFTGETLLDTYHSVMEQI